MATAAETKKSKPWYSRFTRAGAASEKPPKPPTLAEMQQTYYSGALAEKKRSRRLVVVKLIAFAVGMASFLFIVRGHYQLLIDTFGSMGWLCAIAHSYPIFSYVFFKNSNTPDAIVQLYYASLTGLKIVPLPGGTVLDRFMDMSNPRDSDPEQTIFGYMENNKNVGLEDLMSHLADIKAISQDASATAFDAINTFFKYGMPIVMLLAMI